MVGVRTGLIKGECKNKPVSKQHYEAFTTITGAALAVLNNNLDEQAEFIELIEAANIGNLDIDEPLIMHVDFDNKIFND